MRFALAIMLATASIVSPLHAQPVHDECESALPIQGFGEFAFDLREASDSPLVVTNCLNAFGADPAFAADVWYSWNAGIPNLFDYVTIETCGGTGVDTKVAVYDDSCAELNQPFVCDDDTCVFQSRVVFGVDYRVTYLIRVATQPGLGGGTGVFRITRGLTEPPSPSELGCPSPLQSLLQPVALETCNARNRFDAVNSTRTQFVVVDDFVPAESGMLEGVCWWGTYLRDGVECRRNLVDFFEITYYADDCGAPGAVIAGPFSQEDVTMDVIGPLETYAAYPNHALEYQFSAAHDPVAVEGGRTYWIGITNSLYNHCPWYWGLASGHDGYALQIDQNDSTVTPLRSDLAFCSRIVESDGPVCEDRPPVNDDCSDAIPLLNDAEVAFDTHGATTDGPVNVPDYHPLHPSPCDFLLGDEQVHRDVWYRIETQCHSAVTVSACDADFDTKLAIYEGTACPPAERALACADDNCGDGEFSRQAQLSLDADSETIYQIRVGGYDGNLGIGTLTVESSAPRQTDLRDFALFARCFSGGDEPCCVYQNYDADGDIDADDYSAFRMTLVGP